MKEDIRDRWADALESDEFKQGDGALYRIEGKKYCCLGVLCELYVRDGRGEWEDNGTGDMHLYSEGAILPDAVVEWSDLDSNDPYVKHANTMGLQVRNPLTHLNDATYMDFKEIAALIRQQL